MFANLLCAVDFSPPSTHGLRVAAALAHELRASLSLVHAWHPPSVPAAELLAGAAGEARHSGAADVAVRVVQGEAAQQLARVAAEDRHDLVVIGSHGRTGLPRLVLGSVAERVVRESPCSVLVDRVPRDLSALALPTGTHVFRHALCAVDFSLATDTVVRRALDLLHDHRATLSLVHATELDDGYVRDAEARLTTIAAAIRAARDIEVATRVLHGPPVRAVLDAIEADASIDVVVTGTHGLDGVRRLLVGSVAEQIVRRAPIPVLVSR